MGWGPSVFGVPFFACGINDTFFFEGYLPYIKEAMGRIEQIFPPKKLVFPKQWSEKSTFPGWCEPAPNLMAAHLLRDHLL